MKISIIAAMAEQRVIGRDNQMPWHLPADLAHFKALTLGKPILMGRRTFESIGRPLPGRRNLVLTRDQSWSAEGVEIVTDLSTLLDELRAQATPELMVIGGSELYTQLLPQADCLYLTQIQLRVAGDAYFPEFSTADWRCIESESHRVDERNRHPYTFETWIRAPI